MKKFWRKSTAQFAKKQTRKMLSSVWDVDLHLMKNVFAPNVETK
jgi:hypothetical protein